jgi:hypothetical protein
VKISATGALSMLQRARAARPFKTDRATARPVTLRRIPWPPDFPDVVLHATVALRDAHPDYAAAKAGEREPAVRLACALLSDAAVARIGDVLGDRRPILVPVRAVETTGINLIPDAMAHELGQRLGLPVTSEIV